MRGFHLHATALNVSSTRNDDSRFEGSAQDDARKSELSDRAPPRKTVILGVPAFTRDMQVCVVVLGRSKA